MIDYYALPETDLPMSMRHFRRILKERGWKAEKLCRESHQNLFLTRPDGVQLRVVSSTPPTTNAFALQLADNKMMCYSLLNQIGVRQPETISVKTVNDTLPLIQKYGSIVIKPIDAAHGNGVTVGITNAEQAAEAIKKAVAASKDLKIAIAQPQLPPDDLELRVICIDGKFIAAIARIPAAVTGDGVHTLGELIRIENQTIRQPMYQGDLAYINYAAAEEFLGPRINSEIPTKGAKVRVVASCNVGQGGTAKDRTNDISPEMRELSEQIAQITQLAMVGIDFYGDYVIEVNACPMMYYPTGDATATRVIEAYIDYLTQL